MEGKSSNQYTLAKELLVPDILHRVGINAIPEKVSEALTTIDGLRHWWITEAIGDTR